LARSYVLGGQTVGVMKSTDGGQTWTPRDYGLPNLATIRLAIDPDDSNYLMVGFDGQFTAQGMPRFRTLNGVPSEPG
jgi:photosystem II stability/assembly factor-like uncharacterized protein